MLFKAIVGFAFTLASVNALDINVANNCGGGTVKSVGPLTSKSGGFTCDPGNCAAWRVWLDDNNCGANGEGCLLVEGTLTDKGQTSAVDLSIIPPNAFNDPTSFSFLDGSPGKSCQSPDCTCNVDVYCEPDDNGAIAAPGSDNYGGVQINFC